MRNWKAGIDLTRANGFTLIELMVVIVIVGILTSVAIPNYQQYVVRAARSAVQQFMLDIANREEQVRLDMRQYGAVVNNAAFPNAASAGGLGMTVPSEVTGRYNVSVVVNNAATPPTFTITAAPVTGGTQVNDGDVTLNSLGQKTHGSNTTWK